MRTSTGAFSRQREAQSLLDLARNLRATQGPQARVFVQDADGRVRWIVAHIPAESGIETGTPASDWLESSVWRAVAFVVLANVVVLAFAALVRIVHVLW